jgi:hypothetical protein
MTFSTKTLLEVFMVLYLGSDGLEMMFDTYFAIVIMQDVETRSKLLDSNDSMQSFRFNSCTGLLLLDIAGYDAWNPAMASGRD